MTLHILLYTDEPGVGGIAQFNHAVLTALAQRGDRATVVQSYRENPLLAAQYAAGIHHHWLPFDTMADFQRTFTETADARTVLEKYQPDLLLFTDGCPLSNFAAKQVAVELGIPFLVIVRFVAPSLSHHFSEDVEPTSILTQLATYYQKARAVVAVSQNNLDLLRSLFYLPPDQGQVIQSGRPALYFKPPSKEVRELLRKELHIPDDAIVCLTPARLEPIKGYQYQMDAVLRLQRDNCLGDLHFVWVGEGNLQEWLEQTIEQEGLGDRIHLVGHRWDIADWLNMADIFVLPTEAEGMPLAVMEAMAKGLPVVASAVSGIPEELGDTGILLPDPTVDPDKAVEMLVQALQFLASDVQSRIQIGQAGRQRADQLFREERMVQEILQLIDRSLLSKEDYVSPSSSMAHLDTAFPNKVVTDPNAHPSSPVLQLSELNLRSLNWVAFPNWYQPEEALITDLTLVLRFAITHPKHEHLTLLLIADAEPSQVNIALATASVRLFITEYLELTDDGPAISFIPALSSEQWQELVPRLSGQLQLRSEDQLAVASLRRAIAKRSDFSIVSLT